MATKDKFTRQWITERSVPIVKEYKDDNIELTLRGLHYQLVGLGMTNSIKHYKRVVSAMIKARWDGLIDFDDFVDHDREVIGTTYARPVSFQSKVQIAKNQVKAWMNSYRLNRWQNQEYYPEVWIEKKALQGTFQSVCNELDVALAPCKGYPSLTFLNDAAERFNEALDRGQRPVILYFGDYDPSGEDIPRSIGENIHNMDSSVVVKRIALMEHQVIEMNLPPAPAKVGDSRTANWDGLGQVELDAIEPRTLQKMAREAINSVFNPDDYKILMQREKEETPEFIEQLKNFVRTL